MKKVPFLGFLINKKGSAKKLKYEELNSIDKTEDNILWVHFDYSQKEAKNWIQTQFKDSIISDALLVGETRPRTTILGDSLLIALKGVNLEPNSKPENMISIRLYISKNMIISTSRRTLMSIEEIVEDLEKGIGIKSSSEFLVELTNRMIDRIDDVIDEIQDRTDYLEENIMDMKKQDFRTKILNVRRETIILKRYLTPQKDALIKFTSEKISWIDEYRKIEIRETNDQLMRHIEELDTIRDKVILIQEELTNRLSEDLNKKMYILSIISAIFLPLTFLTGLLGINVGGIPGANNENAFYIFTSILILVIFSQYMIFRKKRWI
ncbi:zinc transporter ZntB [Aliarcobacter sp.]|uniref:zinc transporter ZntB n=1 Tax=Aliarcobacter sp. TaxID=2321116 RepID=UPI00356876FF